MTPGSFVFETLLDAAALDVFNWHARPGAFERLVPPWQRVRVLERSGGIRDGDRVELLVGAGLLRTRWQLEHREYEVGRQFCDVQVRGPFAHWVHRHEFVPVEAGRCLLRDEIHYGLPGGAVGAALGERRIRRTLQRVFRYRHRTTADDLRLHAAHRTRPRLTVALSGARGLIGTALDALLTTGGHRTLRLVRRPAAGPAEVQWDPTRGVLEPARLAGVDAVIHLAGESIAGRWTARRMEAIRRSRVDATQALCASLRALPERPRVFLCASAVGLYGDRGAEVLDEDSTPGQGFLADVCQAWEAAARALQPAGVRCVHLRFGVVLTPAGGMLRQLLPAFRLGVGGPVGGGAQYISWVSLDDAIGAAYHALLDDRVCGPVNVVAPRPVTSREFARTLGRVLRRPAVFRVPGCALRLALGRLADEAVLASARVAPAVLTRTDYSFRHPELDAALRHLLGYEVG